MQAIKRLHGGRGNVADPLGGPHENAFDICGLVNGGCCLN
jgi:hypothetical protein